MPEFYSNEAESELKFHIIGQFNMKPKRLYKNEEKVRNNPKHHTSNLSFQNQTKSNLPNVVNS